MPINKNASIRYQTLDKCFRDRLHHYYIEDLMQCFEEALLRYNGIGGVSRRQIFDDIRFMESDSGWNIPLERIKKGKRIHYRYEDPDFSINALPLTEAEARQLENYNQLFSSFINTLKNNHLKIKMRFTAETTETSPLTENAALVKSITESASQLGLDIEFEEE